MYVYVKSIEVKVIFSISSRFLMKLKDMANMIWMALITQERFIFNIELKMLNALSFRTLVIFNLVKFQRKIEYTNIISIHQI